MDQATQETLARLRAERHAEQERSLSGRVALNNTGLLVAMIFGLVNLAAAFIGICLFASMIDDMPVNVIAWVCCLLCIIWFNLGLLFLKGW